MAFTILDGGSFTSTGVGVKIPLPSSADYFRTWNIDKLGAASPTGAVSGEWFGPKFGAGQSAENDGIRWRKAGSAAILIDNFSDATAGAGFTYVTTSPQVEAQAANAITAISAASPAVVTQTNTYSEGDYIRIYNTTGMDQIAGMVFQISTVTSSDYELIGLRAVGFADPATAGNTRRVSKYAAVDPEFLFVTEITKASSAVVRLSVDPSPFYVVGMKVHFSVPPGFGMTEINGLTGTITAISSADYTMTVDINSTSFTTFAFPADGVLTAQRFATIAPAGAKTAYDPITLVQTGYDFTKQPFHTGQFTPYMYLGAGQYSPAGEDTEVINWMAYKLES